MRPERHCWHIAEWRLYHASKHHPWCNFACEGPADTCSMCSGLKADHPVLPGDTPDSLMHRYFPNNKRIED